MTDTTHPVDERLAPPKLFTLGLQHVLVMYAGAIAVPLIIGRALKLPPEDVAFLISADLFACGIATLIQSFGLTQWFGIKLPVMMGVTFAAVGPMVAIAGANPGPDGARMIFGAIIAAGIFAMLVAPLVGRMLAFFPPVVTGSIILVIGVSLMRIGINWVFGNPFGPTAPQIVDPAHADWLKAVSELAATTGSTIPPLPGGLALAAKVSNPAYAPLPPPAAPFRRCPAGWHWRPRSATRPMRRWAISPCRRWCWWRFWRSRGSVGALLPTSRCCWGSSLARRSRRRSAP